MVSSVSKHVFIPPHSQRAQRGYCFHKAQRSRMTFHETHREASDVQRSTFNVQQQRQRYLGQPRHRSAVSAPYSAIVGCCTIAGNPPNSCCDGRLSVPHAAEEEGEERGDSVYQEGYCVRMASHRKMQQTQDHRRPHRASLRFTTRLQGFGM